MPAAAPRQTLASLLALVVLGLSLLSSANAHSPLANQARHKMLSRSRAHHTAADARMVVEAPPALELRAPLQRREVKRSCAAVSSSRSAAASDSATSSVSASRSASASSSASPSSSSAAASASSSPVSQANDGVSTVEVTSTSIAYTTVYSSPPATTSTAAAVTTTSTRATTTSSAAAAATSTVSTVDPDGAGPFSGDATWFATGLGACGWTNTADDYIVAVSQILFDSWPGYAGTNPNNNPICGQKIRVSLDSAGTTVDVSVADRCVGCAERDLDFTTGGFEALVPGGLDVGRIGMTWEWI